MDVQAALKDGYTKDEVMAELGTRTGMNYQQAIKDGHAPDDVLAELNSRDTKTPKKETISTDPRKLPLSTQEKAMGYIRPVVEVGGMLLGGLVGTSAGPIGTAAMTGVGYAGGKRIADILGEKAFGISAPKRTLGEETISTAEDVTLGGITEGIGPLVGRIGGRIAAPFAKTMTPESEQVAKLAAEKGIKLTPAEITQNRPLSLFESALGFTPGSSGVMQRQRIQQLQKLVEQRENILTKISEGRTTEPRSLEQVGLDIKSKIDEITMATKGKSEVESVSIKDNILKSLGAKDTYESLGMSAQKTMAKRSQLVSEEGEKLYSKVWDSLKEDISTTNLQRRADTLLRQEIAKPPSLQNKSVMRVLDDLSGSRLKSKFNLEEFSPAFKEQIEKELSNVVEVRLSPRTVQGVRSELNNRIINADLAYKTQQAGEQKMLSSSEAGVYKQLRRSLEDDINAYFKQSGDVETKKTWEVAQAFWKEGKQTFNRKAVLKAMQTTPDKVIDMVFTPGSTTAINQVKTAIGNSEFERLGHGFTNRIFEKASKGGFEWSKVSSELDKYGEETLKAIYKPNELNSLHKAINEGITKDKPVIDEYFKKILRHASPDTVFNVIFKPNNSENIFAIKRAIPEELFQDAKRVLTEKILSTNEFGLYRPFPSVKGFTKFDEDTLRTIYKPNELKDLKELIQISKRSVGAERIAGNPSGTAQSIITFESGRAVLRHPLTGWSYVIPPNIMARIYLSDTARKYFTSGFRLPGNISQSADLATKLMVIISKQPEEKGGQ